MLFWRQFLSEALLTIIDLGKKIEIKQNAISAFLLVNMVRFILTKHKHVNIIVMSVWVMSVLALMWLNVLNINWDNEFTLAFFPDPIF